MGPCTQCRHFRRVRPASQLLAGVFQNAVSGAEVANAVAKVVDDEQKLRDAEADIKGKEGAADRDLWPMRPMMSEYCGLRESEDIFLIFEVKNRGLGCKDFDGGARERYTCGDCARRVAASGSVADQALDSTYNHMINAAVAVQGSPQMPQAALQSHRAGVVARKALEIAGAYASKGWMLSKPQYLDHCSYFSTQDEYVVCALRNPHGACTAWAPRESDPLRAEARINRTR